MSYNLHLTHKEWIYDEKSPKKIPVKSVKRYIADKPLIKVSREAPDKNRIDFEMYPNTNSKEPDFFFQYDDGDISTTSNHTHKQGFEMLLDMAKTLGVTIRGEENEIYTEDDIDKFPTLDEMKSEQEEFSQRFNEAWNKKTKRLLVKRVLFLCVLVLIIATSLFLASSDSSEGLQIQSPEEQQLDFQEALERDLETYRQELENSR